MKEIIKNMFTCLGIGIGGKVLSNWNFLANLNQITNSNFVVTFKNDTNMVVSNGSVLIDYQLKNGVIKDFTVKQEIVTVA